MCIRDSFSNRLRALFSERQAGRLKQRLEWWRRQQQRSGGNGCLDCYVSRPPSLFLCSVSGRGGWQAGRQAGRQADRNNSLSGGGDSSSAAVVMAGWIATFRSLLLSFSVLFLFLFCLSAPRSESRS